MRIAAIILAVALVAAPMARAAEAGTEAPVTPEQVGRGVELPRSQLETEAAGPSGEQAAPPLPADVYRALDDAAVARGWSGGFKTLGLLQMIGGALATTILLAGDKPGSAVSIGLPILAAGGIQMTIGAAIDSSARKRLLAAGIDPAPEPVAQSLEPLDAASEADELEDAAEGVDEDE